MFFRTLPNSNYSTTGTLQLGVALLSSSSISISITSNFVSLIFSSRDGFKGSLFSSVVRDSDPDHAIIRIHGRPPVLFCLRKNKLVDKSSIALGSSTGMVRRNAGPRRIPSNGSLVALRPRLSDGFAFVSVWKREGSKADHPNNDRHLLAFGGPTSMTPILGF